MSESDALIELANSMFQASREGNVETLVPLLDQGAPLDMLDAEGNSMLMLAAYHGHAALVRELASRGADVDLLNDRGQSPLAGAIFKGDTETTRVLLEFDADPDLGTPTARQTAEMFHRNDIF